jgi:hypothetical protein
MGVETEGQQQCALIISALTQSKPDTIISALLPIISALFPIIKRPIKARTWKLCLFIMPTLAPQGNSTQSTRSALRSLVV